VHRRTLDAVGSSATFVGGDPSQGSAPLLHPTVLGVAHEPSLVMTSLLALIRAEAFADHVWGPVGWEEAPAASRRHRPEVVLIEYATNGAADAAAQTTRLLGRVRLAHPAANALLFVHYEADIDAATVAAAEAGAGGIVRPDADVDAFRRSLEDAARGLTRLEVEDVGPLAKRLDERRDRVTRFRRQVSSLTGREQEVLIAIGRGLRNGAIASELGISLRTVEKHVEHVLQKLDVASRSQALRIVLELRGST
jgi:DNA-binding NarL/FixJ family response regulator